MDSKEKEILHIITKSGERKTISFPGQSQYQPSQESFDSDFEIDYEWYDNHGYMNIDDVRKLIEGKDYNNG